MNFIALVFVLTLAVGVKGGFTKEEVMESLRALTVECSKETGATEADVENMMTNTPAKTMETKCLRACIMKKVNVVTPDGKFDKENALKLAEMHTKGDPEKIKIATAMADVCMNIPVPDDHCEAAELYKMCLLSEAKKHGVNPSNT